MKQVVISSVAAYLAMAGSVSAAGIHDRPCRATAMRPPIRSTQTHDGSSPFPPPEEDDTLFTVDSGSGLDTDCTYHSGGPLVIHLPVKRYVGPVNGDGTLLNATALVNAGLLSENAHLRLPAYDVDVNGDPNDSATPPEVDRVTFNGHDIGTLTGDNDIWKLNEFEVPIAWVKFPALDSAGGAPEPADNVITIDIDTASGGVDNWCTSVDWFELDFKAIAPVFLVHGTGVGAASWEPYFTDFFGKSGAVWSNDINLSKLGSIVGNGDELATRLEELATRYGARKCHIIAHSKGGLDTRAYLNNQYDPTQLQVLSVYTLSTPHHGTPLANLAVAAELAIGPDALLLQEALFPAPSDQTTFAMADFNMKYPGIPGSILFYNYGADADLNRDSLIESNEAEGLFPLPDVTAGFATMSYLLIGNATPVTITIGTQQVHLWGDVSFPVIDIQITHQFAANDLVVSADSAHSPFGTYLATRQANHSTIKSEVLAQEILNRIVGDFPNQ